MGARAIPTEVHSPKNEEATLGIQIRGIFNELQLRDLKKKDAARLAGTEGTRLLGRPYYVARTSLDTLTLLAPPPGQDGPEGGSNSLRWWRLRESNPRPRTVTPRNQRSPIRERWSRDYDPRDRSPPARVPELLNRPLPCRGAEPPSEIAAWSVGQSMSVYGGTVAVTNVSMSEEHGS